MTLIAILIGVICNVGLVIYLLLSIRTLKDERTIRSEIKQDFAAQQTSLGNLLQMTSADIAERIVRSSGNLRQEIADRITEEFLHIQERIDT